MRGDYGELKELSAQRKEVEIGGRPTGVFIVDLLFCSSCFRVFSSCGSDWNEGKRWSGISVNFGLNPLTLVHLEGLRVLVDQWRMYPRRGPIILSLLHVVADLLSFNRLTTSLASQTS